MNNSNNINYKKYNKYKNKYNLLKKKEEVYHYY